MKINLALGLFLLASIISTPAYAFDEPDGFKNWKFGTPSSDVKGSGDIGGVVKDYLGDITVEVSFSYYWDRSQAPHIQRLGMIYISFQEYNYKVMRDTFIARYGQPTSSKVTTYTSGFGGKFHGEVVEWAGQTATIVVSQYGGKRTVGNVMIYSKAWEEGRKNEELERSRKAAGDLR